MNNKRVILIFCFALLAGTSAAIWLIPKVMSERQRKACINNLRNRLPDGTSVTNLTDLNGDGFADYVQVYSNEGSVAYIRLSNGWAQVEAMHNFPSMAAPEAIATPQFSTKYVLTNGEWTIVSHSQTRNRTRELSVFGTNAPKPSF